MSEERTITLLDLWNVLTDLEHELSQQGKLVAGLVQQIGTALERSGENRASVGKAHDEIGALEATVFELEKRLQSVEWSVEHPALSTDDLVALREFTVIWRRRGSLDLLTQDELTSVRDTMREAATFRDTVASALTRVHALEEKLVRTERKINTHSDAVTAGNRFIAEVRAQLAAIGVSQEAIDHRVIDLEAGVRFSAEDAVRFRQMQSEWSDFRESYLPDLKQMRDLHARSVQAWWDRLQKLVDVPVLVLVSVLAGLILLYLQMHFNIVHVKP